MNVNISKVSHPIQSWKWSEKPWVRVHTDYICWIFLRSTILHFNRCIFQVDRAETTEHAYSIFATHGLSKMPVTDNGSIFKSEEIKTFAEQNGMHHMTSIPYHPALNRLTKTAVQILKFS